MSRPVTEGPSPEFAEAMADGPWAPPGLGLTPSALVPCPGVCRVYGRRPHPYHHLAPERATEANVVRRSGEILRSPTGLPAPPAAGSRLSQGNRSIRFTFPFVSATGDALSAFRVGAVLEVRSESDIVWLRQDGRFISMAAGHSGLARGGRRLSYRKAGGQVTAGFLLAHAPGPPRPVMQPTVRGEDRMQSLADVVGDLRARVAKLFAKSGQINEEETKSALITPMLRALGVGL